jgi:hypothetical protein
MKKLMLALPGWLLCGLICLIQVENIHYGFENPGMSDKIVIIVLFCILAIGYALIALLLSRKEKLDFVFQYVTVFFVIVKLIKIISLFSSYYWRMFYHL